ncbi:MAG TPA: hypothetical protein VFW50_30255 [Streptosporangiaceae bacterium]|nr:hypothetical protein [Streptosporangiaceae bacterium]
MEHVLVDWFDGDCPVRQGDLGLVAGVADEQGERGEICVRGPQVMAGYWNDREATDEVIDADGWFHTGDIGQADEDGYVYVVDRLKDMVITGGENVYPAEVETVLYGHPAIAEVAVLGTPHQQWGEAVTAVAALNPGAALTP